MNSLDDTHLLSSRYGSTQGVVIGAFRRDCSSPGVYVASEEVKCLLRPLEMLVSYVLALFYPLRADIHVWPDSLSCSLMFAAVIVISPG